MGYGLDIWRRGWNHTYQKCRYNSEPEAVVRILEYLYATNTLAIQYGGGQEKGIQTFLCYSDASCADSKDRKSFQGYIMTLFRGFVVWKTSEQARIITSSNEAELLTLSNTIKKAMYLKRLFQVIKLKMNDFLIIDCDNKHIINVMISKDMNFHILDLLQSINLYPLYPIMPFNPYIFDRSYRTTSLM